MSRYKMIVNDRVLDETPTRTAHTPGPWCESTKGDNRYQSAVYREDTGGTVCVTYTANDADARLIAAAPELLAILKRIVNRANAPMSNGDIDYDDVAAAYAAIAKAEGR